MKLSIQFVVTTLTILLITIGHRQATQAADFDHSKFDQILKTYVDTEGRVDYNGIAADNTFREYMRSLENTMRLSKLFDWFAGDFESKSGSVTNFIKPYLDEKAMAFIERMPKMSYIEYDWALNAKEPLK